MECNIELSLLDSVVEWKFGGRCVCLCAQSKFNIPGDMIKLAESRFFRNAIQFGHTKKVWMHSAECEAVRPVKHTHIQTMLLLFNRTLKWIESNLRWVILFIIIEHLMLLAHCHITYTRAFLTPFRHLYTVQRRNEWMNFTNHLITFFPHFVFNH